MATKSKKLHNAFTEEHLEIIRKVYADTPNKVIATMIPTPLLPSPRKPTRWD